jgi:hypothetical protein
MKLFPDFGVAIDEKYSGIRNCGLVPDGKTSKAAHGHFFGVQNYLSNSILLMKSEAAANTNANARRSWQMLILKLFISGAHLPYFLLPTQRKKKTTYFQMKAEKYCIFCINYFD